MVGRTAKRSSDDCVFADTKKKKISKEKGETDAVVSNEKASTLCNGDLRQKKAFFAYFGKSFDEGKNSTTVYNGGNSKTTDSNHSVTKQNIIVKTSSCGDSSKTPLVINTKKKDIQLPNDAVCIIKSNANLPYISSFVEEFGCFPKITHTNHPTSLRSSDPILCLKEEVFHENCNKNSILTFKTVHSLPKRLVLEPYQMEINFPYMISSLKTSVPNFPVSDFHKNLKKKHLVAKKSTTDIESMWIDKYKPMCKEEVLGNGKLVKDLKNWLAPNKKNSKKPKKGQKYDDDDDFIFDSDSESSCKQQLNLAILLGPSGCGKTSTVYAVANELNANVIELNASCNRNGKRIITDLMEATQSHAVEKNCLLNLIKGKKIKIKKHKTKEKANEKMTIILIEDADIFFENHDDGFLAAISTLATDSKRPLILTANDPFSNHLLKFFLSNETLHFIHPPKEDLNCFLQLIALNEGVIMTKDEINAFIHPFKPDIRQSTLQLQYVLSSGEIDQKVLNQQSEMSLNSIWWNWPHMIGCHSTSVEDTKQPKCNVDISTISRNLDIMSELNLIYSKTQSYNFLDPQPFWHHLATRDSSSLIETHHWSDSSILLSTDITQWIYNHINTRDNIPEKLYPTSEELNLRQRTWNTSKDVLEQIGLDYCNRKNETSYDYLSTIRSMYKNQHINQSFVNLRNSKMFSYLRQININVDNKDLNYLCDSFHSDSNNYDPQLEISDQF
ncbi:enhanced level of genomic instability 1 [Metopolophium dirhodum]|uniref:enhanced level of genomic instability 1 n=1 Tax=Metopolophium dirhodum TaxID=44670 RepID=UPI00299011A3|nr:enhanced level of genomic instability 1 [Metopolophium dirhodum]